MLLQIIEIQSDNVYQQIYKPEYLTYRYVYLATQDDNVGPSDIVLYENEDKSGNVMGLSVKYNNGCNVNISSLNFLTQEDKEELKKRVDLRDLTIVTIDGEDAKDLDDAVYKTKKEKLL